MQPTPITRPWYGASWKIAAFACYAGLNAIARYLSGGAQTSLEVHLPVYLIVFFQDLFALLILLPWMVSRGRIAFIPNHFLLHLFRVLTSTAAIVCWYFALMYMKLSEAVALSIIGPMMGVVGARWFLKEKLGGTRTLVILLSLGGACLLLRPVSVFLDNHSNITGLSFVFLAALFFAIAKLATRKLALLGESPQTLTSTLFIFIVPISFILALFHWETPSLTHLPWLILAGFLTAMAIYCVSCALVYAEISFLAPFDICQFILNSLIGYVAFTELPGTWAIWLLLAFLGFSLTTRSGLKKNL